MAYLVLKKKLSLVCPVPKTYAIMEIMPSRIKCESKNCISMGVFMYSEN